MRKKPVAFRVTAVILVAVAGTIALVWQGGDAPVSDGTGPNDAVVRNTSDAADSPSPESGLGRAEELLSRLESTLDDLDAAVASTEEELLATDPYLQEALVDPLGTPFRPQSPLLHSDVVEQAFPTIARLVSRFPAERDSELPEVLQRVLQKTLIKTQVSDDDVRSLSKAYDNGSRDPLLLLCLFRCSRAINDRESTDRWAYEAYQHRARRDTDPLLKALITSSAVRSAPRENKPSVSRAFIEETAEFWQAYRLSDGNFAINDLLIDYFYNGFTALTRELQAEMLLALDAKSDPAVEPWILHFAAAVALHRQARQYRGNDFISNVPADDLRSFDTTSRRACKHMMKAWTLAPRISLIASLLMDYESVSGNTFRSVDHWFRHALATRFEDGLIFSVWNRMIARKWGGSRERQIWFAEKCVESGDLQSGIPFHFVSAFKHRMWETGYTERLGSDLRVVRVAKQFVQLLRDSGENPHPAVTRTVLTYLIVVLWQAGDIHDLAWLIPFYDTLAVERDFYRFRLSYSEVRALTRVLAIRPHPIWLQLYRDVYLRPNDLTHAEVLGYEADIAEARARTLPEEHGIRGFVNVCELRLRFLEKFLRNETVTLSDADILDWYQGPESMRYLVSGYPENYEELPAEDLPPIKRDNVGSINYWCSMRVDHALWTCPLPLYPPLRFSADLEVLHSEPDSTGFSLLIGADGFQAAISSNIVGPIVTLDASHTVLRDHLPGVYWKQGEFFWRQLDRREKHNVAIEAFPDGYRVFADGQLLEEVSQPLNTRGMVQFGRYNNARFQLPDRETHYRISNIQLQRLRETGMRDSAVSQPE